LRFLSFFLIKGDVPLEGLFNQPHSAYISHLRHLTFAHMAGYTGQDYLPALVGVLSHLPPTNVIETLLVEVRITEPRESAPVLIGKEEMLSFLEHLTRRRFPALRKVTVVISVVECLLDKQIPGLTKKKQELEGMKWDFGSLFIDIVEGK